MDVLVDTSVWSLALRRNQHDLNAEQHLIVGQLAELIREGRARLLGLIRQELLSGIKTTAQFERLRDTLRAFPDERIDTADYETAAKASNDCRGKGITVSVVDILICAVAIKRDQFIFTTDADFESYAEVLPLKFHRAVEKR